MGDLKINANVCASEQTRRFKEPRMEHLRNLRNNLRVMPKSSGSRFQYEWETNYALDNFCNLVCSLASRFAHFLHHGWIHPHFIGRGAYRFCLQFDSGPKTNSLATKGKWNETGRLAWNCLDCSWRASSHLPWLWLHAPRKSPGCWTDSRHCGRTRTNFDSASRRRAGASGRNCTGRSFSEKSFVA